MLTCTAEKPFIIPPFGARRSRVCVRVSRSFMCAHHRMCDSLWVSVVCRITHTHTQTCECAPRIYQKSYSIYAQQRSSSAAAAVFTCIRCSAPRGIFARNATTLRFHAFTVHAQTRVACRASVQRLDICCIDASAGVIRFLFVCWLHIVRCHERDSRMGSNQFKLYVCRKEPTIFKV